jgi:hypothetical protein
MSVKTFNVLAILGVLFFYAIAAQFDHPMPDPKVERNNLLTTALDSRLDGETRATAAQAFCGNAGFSIEDNAVTCIPRHGKPYSTKILR